MDDNVSFLCFSAEAVWLYGMVWFFVPIIFIQIGNLKQKTRIDRFKTKYSAIPSLLSDIFQQANLCECLPCCNFFENANKESCLNVVALSGRLGSEALFQSALDYKSKRIFKKNFFR